MKFVVAQFTLCKTQHSILDDKEFNTCYEGYCYREPLFYHPHFIFLRAHYGQSSLCYNLTPQFMGLKVLSVT